MESAVIDDFVRFHPHDKAVPFLMASRELFHKNYAAARQALDEIDEIIGGDPYINVRRAEIAIAQQDYAEARKVLDAGLEAEPTLVGLHYAMAELGAAVGDFPLIRKHLSILRDELDCEIDTPKLDERFKEFLKSEEYVKYLAGTAVEKCR